MATLRAGAAVAAITMSELARHDGASAVEALLFAAGRPLSLRRLAEALGVGEADATSYVEALELRLAQTGSALRIRRTGGVELVTEDRWNGLLRRSLGEMRSKLTEAALEVLAAVAYHQPISVERIDRLRGVRSDRTLAALEERGLIDRQLSSEGSLQYVTTDRFLSSFGIGNLSELPAWPQAGVHRGAAD